MKRLVLAACLLSAPGLALGQSVVITTGDIQAIAVDAGGSITLTAGGINLGDLQLTLTQPAFGEFQPISSTVTSGPFPARFELSGTAAQLGNAREAPVMIDPAALGGMPVIITVEEEGVRLPDEQFTLP